MSRQGAFKLLNNYVGALHDVRGLYQDCPKAVFAAIAVSGMTNGGDRLEEAATLVLREWWVLYDNGIVPQKPPFPRPADEVLP